MYVIIFVAPEHQKQRVLLLFHVFGLCLMDPGSINMDPFFIEFAQAGSELAPVQKHPARWLARRVG